MQAFKHARVSLGITGPPVVIVAPSANFGRSKYSNGGVRLLPSCARDSMIEIRPKQRPLVNGYSGPVGTNG